MTRIAADRIELEQDGLSFGDPIGCGYHWTEPDEIDAYGDSVRHLANKVELAVDGFERTAGLSEEVFAGDAADTLRGRAAERHEESATVRDNLRGLGRAINAYSDVLRRHREGLEQLRALAASRGLEVRGNQIWPPVETLPGDASQKEVDAWERDWKSYQACFDTKIELRDARRASSRELVKALAEFAGVHPEKDRTKIVAAGGNQVSFGELRHKAAEEAMEAVAANDAAERARQTVDSLKRREQGALDRLEDLATSGASHEEIAAQADKVARLHEQVTDAQVEARDAEATAQREQAQANRAARDLEAAEEGRPRIISQSRPMPEESTQPADLRGRLG